MLDRQITQKMIGRKLKRLRQNYNENGLTQSELADRFAQMGHPRTQGYLSEVESAKASMSLDDFITFLNLYELTPNQMFGLESEALADDGISELAELLDEVSPARRRLYAGLIRLLVEAAAEERQKNSERLHALLQTARLFGDDVVEKISDLIGVELDATAAAGTRNPRRKQRADEAFNLT